MTNNNNCYCSKDDCESFTNLNKELCFTTPFLSSSTLSEGMSFCSDDDNDFGMNVLYPLSSATFDKRYDEQSLVVLVFNQKINFKNLTSSIIDVQKIIAILIFERGVDFQCYRVVRLSTCPHFTLLTKDLPTFVKGFEQYADALY